MRAHKPPTRPPAPAPHRRSATTATVVRLTPFVVFVGGIVAIVIGPLAIGAVLVGIAGIAFSANCVAGSSRRMISRLGGRRADAKSEAALLNIVERICVAHGVAVPELRIIDDDAPNTIVLGRTPRKAVLFCTTGVLRLMDVMELEGLVAHELAHVKFGDLHSARTATTALGFFGSTSTIGARAIVRLCGPQREVLADREGVAMTRYPPGLIGALEKLEAAPNVRPAVVSVHMARLTAGMWCAPLREARTARVIAGALDMELRIAALREL